MTFSKDKRQETIIYLVLWGLLFIAPVLSQYIRNATDAYASFNWHEVMLVWRQLAVFFVIFLLHNHLLAPMLIYRQKKVLYALSFTALLAVFVVYQCNVRPAEIERRHKPDMEMRHHRGPDKERMNHRTHDMEMPPPRPDMDGDHRPKGEPHHRMKPMIFGQHDIVATIVLLLMLGANLGLKLYFKQQRDRKKMELLQQKNMEQQLEYLKYQLNPHFLMNTLNNIHALIDIDSQQAQEAVIMLSKILRYVLYESNHERVPMSRETEFMQNYIQLMRMRYDDNLKLSVNTDDSANPYSVPPLLFITFVENAFKHGVSYQHLSFIKIDSKHYKDKNQQDRLLWTCCNSRYQNTEKTQLPKQGGVGMTNIRQRLDLIFADDYTLKINQGADTYEVMLDIPLEEPKG